MAAPICTHVCHSFKSVRDTVIELLLLRVRLCVGFRHALCDNLCVTLFMAGIFAIRTLHACRVLEKVTAERTTHDIVELLLHKPVPIHLMYLFFTRTDCTFSSKPKIEWTFVLVKFGWEN